MLPSGPTTHCGKHEAHHLDVMDTMACHVKTEPVDQAKRVLGGGQMEVAMPSMCETKRARKHHELRLERNHESHGRDNKKRWKSSPQLLESVHEEACINLTSSSPLDSISSSLEHETSVEADHHADSSLHVKDNQTSATIAKSPLNETTLRKARVSIRVRSEAPMVILKHHHSPII